jgi:cell wall integrity and stress response component
VVTEAGQTIVVTAASETNATTHSKSSSNTAGIAVGVVVGVVGFASLVGGAIFFYRYKRRKSIEEEYRRNAEINNFVTKDKPMSSSSMSDSRFDGDFMAQRRQSNGSIADDQDFSRRILKVGFYFIGLSFY